MNKGIIYLQAGKYRIKMVLKEDYRSVKFRGIKDSLKVEMIKETEGEGTFMVFLPLAFLCQLNQNL